LSRTGSAAPSRDRRSASHPWAVEPIDTTALKRSLEALRDGDHFFLGGSALGAGAHDLEGDNLTGGGDLYGYAFGQLLKCRSHLVGLLGPDTKVLI
jgi:hypothetical protein